MERLTMHSSRDKENILWAPIDEIAIVEKLAAYEDTGLTPDDIKSYAEGFKRLSHISVDKDRNIDKLTAGRDYWKAEAIKATAELGEMKIAEEQGLLIKIPCKIGDTVYEVNSVRNMISTYKVTSVTIMTGSRNYRWELIDGVYSNINGFNEYALGRTVFLTKEAAETALKKQ